MRRELIAAAVVLLTISGAACGGRSNSVATGDDVDLCTALRYLNRFTEPRPEDKTEVLQYAQGFVDVIDRIDKRRDLAVNEELKNAKKRLKASPKALADTRVIRAAMVRLRSAVKATADDGDAIRAATNDLAADEKYAAAERRVTAYYGTTCRVE